MIIQAFDQKIKEGKAGEIPQLFTHWMQERRIMIKRIQKKEGTMYYYELSFINLPREWRRIPFHCKEAIPRKFEKGWDTKLAMKYQVLCIAKDHDIECGMPSKKELKMGCRRMESVAKVYWQSK